MEAVPSFARGRTRLHFLHRVVVNTQHNVQSRGKLNDGLAMIVLDDRTLSLNEMMYQNVYNGMFRSHRLFRCLVCCRYEKCHKCFVETREARQAGSIEIISIGLIESRETSFLDHQTLVKYLLSSRAKI